MSLGISSKLYVGLVFGGRSSEHRISISTAAAVLKYSSRLRYYEFVPIYFSESGTLHAPPLASVIEVGANLTGPVQALLANPVNLELSSNGSLIAALHTGRRTEVSAVYPIILGNTGESGSIYGFLELSSTPWVGPSSKTSAVLYDKSLQKNLARKLKVPIVKYVAIDLVTDRLDEQFLRAQLSDLGLPVVVKPTAQGSSIGVSICDTLQDVKRAIAIAEQFDSCVLLEQYIEAPEMMCYVWAGERITKSSKVLSLEPRNRIYSFDQKYGDTPPHGVTWPSELPMSRQQPVIDMTRRIYQQLKGSGLWRIDYFLPHSGGLCLNEINTVPSLVGLGERKHLLTESGYDPARVIEEIVETALALER